MFDWHHAAQTIDIGAARISQSNICGTPAKSCHPIKLRAVAANGTMLAITATGYLSHFLTTGRIGSSGWAIAFFTAWLDREAKNKKWREAKF